MRIAERSISPTQAWILAARPKTLPAAVAPVFVGTALAFAEGVFKPFPALAALLGSMLLQIAVNLANDYFDHVRGVDTPDRIGPVRVAASGLISPRRLRFGMLLVIALSALVGVYLAWVGGWLVLVIGVASILSLLAYSSGPFPLASHGLGDLFVFLFFGVAAVCGTYYVQAQRVTLMALAAAVPVGLLTTAILVINNLRDIETDRQAGKHTLAVLLGPQGARLEYALLCVVAYGVVIAFWGAGWFKAWVLLPIAAVPLAVRLIARVYAVSDGKALNAALAGTAQLDLLFNLLFALGLILG
jgi:1,4-dihydroxy-2-naphthoate octaprenyltransferase